jgi:hypothetical protein
VSPKINNKKLKLAQLFNYININVVPKLKEEYKKRIERLREERLKKLMELMERHKQELEPIMKDPVPHIMEVLEALHVGDEKAKHQLLAVIASRFLPREHRLGVVITAPSSSGKNHLVNSFMKITPSKWWMVLSRLTQNSLNYLSKSVGRKILYIQEYEGVNQSAYNLRITLSEGKLTVLYVKRNEKTGEFETVKKEVVGTPVLITTTTAVSIDEDMENRTFYVSIDTSDEQTRRIIEYEKKRASDPNFIAL